MELENQPFSLSRCIEEALDQVAAKAAEKNLEIAYQIQENLPLCVIGDLTRLRQILVNLLSNSVKFTDRGEVTTSVSGTLQSNGQYLLHFTVRDTGMGIPPELQDKLFQSFSQVDVSTNRRFGGTGLGLAISKRLCEMMGGTIWVESSGKPGEGSAFNFTILASASAEQPSQEAPDAAILAG